MLTFFFLLTSWLLLHQSFFLSVLPHLQPQLYTFPSTPFIQALYKGPTWRTRLIPVLLIDIQIQTGTPTPPTLHHSTHNIASFLHTCIDSPWMISQYSNMPSTILYYRFKSSSFPLSPISIHSDRFDLFVPASSSFTFQIEATLIHKLD